MIMLESTVSIVKPGIGGMNIQKREDYPDFSRSRLCHNERPGATSFEPDSSVRIPWACEAAWHYTACLLSARCATRGKTHVSSQLPVLEGHVLVVSAQLLLPEWFVGKLAWRVPHKNAKWQLQAQLYPPKNTARPVAMSMCFPTYCRLCRLCPCPLRA